MTRGAPAGDRPPLVARVLLRLTLDAGAWEIVSGDLEEEFRYTLSRTGRRAATRQYWRLAVASIASHWRDSRLRSGVPEIRKDTFRMDTLAQDLRFGLRQMRGAPAVTLAAVVTLAIGITAAATVYGLINALVLRPLAYAEPDRVAFVLGRDVTTDDLLFNMRYADVEDLADAGIFDDVGFYRATSGTLTGGALPERVQAYRVSANTFDVLGVPAAHGRSFSPADVASGDGRVVVLSHGLWMQRFGGDDSILGRLVSIDGGDYTVLGVMPAEFEFPVFNFKGDLWMPLVVTPEWRPGDRSQSPSVVAIARLADGVGVAASQTATDAVMARISAAYPESNGRRGAVVRPMADLGTEQSGPVFGLLAAAAVLVLLVACANVANLLLARSAGRTREMAVRAAMGAGRLRLVRQLLVESLTMAAAAGGLAFVLTSLALTALRGAMPAFIVRVLPGVDAVGPDLRALAVAAGVSLTTVLFFGLLPAWQASAAGSLHVLHAGGRLTPSRRRRWIRHGLVVGEVAMSVVLLAVTVLLARSAGNFAAADPGFDKTRLLALSLSLSAEAAEADADALDQSYRRMTDRVAAVPGIESVGLVQTLPFSTSDSSVSFEVVGRPGPEGAPPTAGFRVVTPEYFETIGLPVKVGRVLDQRDGRAGRAAVMVNERFAERYLDGVDRAVGERLRLDRGGDGDTSHEIVGVVADVRHMSLAEAPAAEIYVPYLAAPRRTMTMAVRTAGDPVSMIPSVRAAIADVDRRIAPYDVAPMSELIGNSYLAQTVAAAFMQVFGLAALLLAAVGLYGVLSFAVAQRTREIGVRVALGATRRDVVRMVLRQSLVLVGAGILLGLVAAALGGSALSALLFGVGPFDPSSYAGTAAVLLGVGLLASYAPMQRALGVDPVVSLRAD